MSKHKRKRFLSILVTAVLVFTLAFSSVMAQDDDHVRTDKLSVEGESVEVIEGVVGEDDMEIVEDEAITADDAEAEEADADEAADSEEISAEDALEEADADISDAAEDDAEADAGIMTLSAGDAEDEEDYGIQTLADGDVTLISGSTETSYSSIANALSDASEGDTIRMNANISESISVDSGKKVTLDLNGHTLSKGSKSTVITLEGGSLTLTDTSDEKTGTVTGGSASDGAGVELNSAGSEFIMYGGTITKNTASGSATKVGGGGVDVHYGTFTMYGGTITENYANSGYGGGVLVLENGTFVMEDGAITNNTAAHGAGVTAYGVFTMNGGTISGNEVSSSSVSGGGVLVYGNSSIEGYQFTMTGGEISENKATQTGGGICLADTSGYGVKALISGGTVKGNTVTSGNGYGGGIHIQANSSLTISGDAEISGNTSLYGGGIYCLGSVTMESGSISENTQTSNNDPGGGGVVLDGGTFTMNGGEISKNESTYSGAGVYAKGSSTFTLNGGSVSNNICHYDGGGFCLVNTAALVMNGGYITGNTAGYGAGVQFCSTGTFTMTGGEISGNIADTIGGGMELNGNGSTLDLSGGAITGNTAPDGGGVYLRNANAKMIVSGGAVSGNTDTNGAASNVDLSYNKSLYITLGADLSSVPQTLATVRAADQIGVTTATDPSYDTTTQTDSPVEFTAAESGTGYYSTSNLYFFSDVGTTEEGYAIGVRASSNGNYLELYVITPPTFETNYLIDPEDPDRSLYTEATLDNYEQILSGEADWNALMDLLENGTDDEKAAAQETIDQINADLTAAYRAATGDEDGELTYPMLLAQAQAIAEYMDFENDYLTGSDGNLYTEATEDNYEQILAGAEDWENLSDEAKAQINADLTAAWQEAGGEGELTYEDLLKQAQDIANAREDANAFENNYLGGTDSLYTEATADNYQDILAGASDWANMSDEAKALVNADLTAAWQAAGNDGELTYDDLLAQAFRLAYLTDEDGDGPYTEVTADNMDQILAGAADWANMSEEAKAAVNAALTDANDGEPLTYDDLLADAFQQKYLTDEDGNGPYTAATADNYEQILAGADDWDAMSDEAKAAVNAALTEANGGVELTYEDLLAQAQAYSAAADFIYSYVSDSDVDNPYLTATVDNYEQILSGEDAWNAMSAEEQAAVNAILTEANGGEELTYPMLLEQAKALSAASDFIYSYVSDSDVDNPYLTATVDNYEQILSGEDAWNAMSAEEQAAVNAILTAANGGEELTYPMLLLQAKALDFEEKYLTDENGNGPYTAATFDNMDQILAGADDWNAMSDEEKAAVNAALTEANGGKPLTYDELLAQAFILKYLTDEDGNLITEVNEGNYQKILSGADDWYRLSPEAQALVNAYLTAAWQDAGNEGELTYPMLLEEAEAFAAGLGNVKTGDNTHLYLYVILAAAAAAAAAGTAVYRRRRI